MLLGRRIKFRKLWPHRFGQVWTRFFGRQVA
jgi:hypothetical protein